MLTTPLLDTLLVIAGLVLVVTGLVMFIRSKTSSAASSVEAFGIKLNVTHPSLILVLAGVGLMLAPRLLPEPPGKAAEPTPAVAGAPQPEPAPAIGAEPAAADALPAPPSPAAQPATPAPRAAAATRPATPPTAPVPVPYPNATRTPPARAAIAAVTRPAVQPVPAKNPAAPPAAAPSTAPAKAPPPSPAARPTLAYAALGLPIGRSFWSGETRTSYTQRMHGVLHEAGRDVLRMEPRGLSLGEKEFDAWWNEANTRPQSRERCATSPAPAALLSARVETPVTISSVDSAYWPELRLRLFVCASQRVYTQQKTLAPHHDDSWPFSVELNSEIERFLRTYRQDVGG